MSGSENQSEEKTGNSLVTEEKMIESVNNNDVKTNTFVETPITTMPTLPGKLKSLVGVSINIEDKNPRNLIILIGQALGVDDYATNMASFWFLDFIALQVLLFENYLDEYGKSVLISWLAGEMQLIREKKLSHDAFWCEMKEIFDKCSKKLTSHQPLLHWDLIIQDYNFGEIIMEKESQSLAKVSKISQGNVTGSRASSKSQEKRTWSQNRSSSKSVHKSKTNKLENDNEKSVPKPEVFDVVKEATYNMYGDRFHYTLIVAAFVEPVPVIDYKLPYKFQVPRPIKMYNPETSKKAEIAPAPRKSKDLKKNKDGKKNNQNRDTKTADIIKDPVIPTDEEILMEKRRFILPLMEAIEAADILKEFKESQS